MTSKPSDDTNELFAGSMGERADYAGITEEQLDRLVDADAATLPVLVQELRAAGAPTFSLGEMWDGLHFLLTGVSAATPIEDDPLSEAVVGVHLFDAPEFMGCTEHDELRAVLDALASIDIEAKLAAARFTAFDDAGIWPDDWNEYGDERHQALADAFAQLVRFTQECLDSGLHLIVSIATPER